MKRRNNWYSYECITSEHERCDAIDCGCQCHAHELQDARRSIDNEQPWLEQHSINKVLSNVDAVAIEQATDALREILTGAAERGELDWQTLRVIPDDNDAIHRTTLRIYIRTR